MRELMLEPKKLQFGTRDHDTQLDWCMERFRASSEAKRPVEEMALVAYKNFRCYLNREKHPFPVAVYDPVFFGTLLTAVSNSIDALFVSPPIFDFETDSPRGGRDELTEALQCESNDHLKRMQPWLPLVKGLIGQHLVGTQYFDFWWDYEEYVCAGRKPSETMREFLSSDGSLQTVAIPTMQRVLRVQLAYDGPRFAPRHITRAYADTDEEDLQRGEFFARRDEVSADAAKQMAKAEGWNKANTERAIRDTDAYAIRAGLSEMRDTADWLQQIGLDTQQRFTSIVQRKRVEVLRFYHRRRGQVLKTVILNRAVVVYYGPSEFDHGLYPAVKSTNYVLQGEHFGVSDWEITRWLIQGIQTLRNAGCTEALIGTMPVLLKRRDMQVDNARYEPNAFWDVDDVDGIKPLQRGSNGAALGNQEADLLRQVADSALGSGGETGRGNVDSKATATAIQQALGAAGTRGKFRANNIDEQFIVPGARQWGDLLNQYSEDSLVAQAVVFPVPTAAASINQDLQQKRLMQLLEVAGNHPVVKSDELVRLMVETIAPTGMAERILRSPEEMAPPPPPPGGPGPGGPGGGPPLEGPEPFGGGDPVTEQAAEMRQVMAA